jgi:hypothetical protein
MLGIAHKLMRRFIQECLNLGTFSLSWVQRWALLDLFSSRLDLTLARANLLLASRVETVWKVHTATCPISNIACRQSLLVDWSVDLGISKWLIAASIQFSWGILSCIASRVVSGHELLYCVLIRSHVWIVLSLQRSKLAPPRRCPRLRVIVARFLAFMMDLDLALAQLLRSSSSLGHLSRASWRLPCCEIATTVRLVAMLIGRWLAPCHRLFGLLLQKLGQIHGLGEYYIVLV